MTREFSRSSGRLCRRQGRPVRGGTGMTEVYGDVILVVDAEEDALPEMAGVVELVLF